MSVYPGYLRAASSGVKAAGRIQGTCEWRNIKTESVFKRVHREVSDDFAGPSGEEETGQFTNALLKISDI
jgi:hypothetical protein